MGGTGGTATNGALAGGTGYGYNGGSSSTTTKYGGGGGGGAGSTGGGGSGSAAGAGGTGTSNSITGTATYYGGGGGGGIVSTGTIGTGGSSIGGSGGNLGSSPTNAAASTGSGGGGAGGKTAAGGTGAGGVIIVSYTQLPGASFTMNTTSGYSPLAVSFTDTSNPVGTSWQWGFNNVTGNNTWTNFATTENPVWTFGIGNYSVNLTATNSGGSSKFTNTTFINVTAVPPVAAFTMNKTSGYSPLAVSFTDTSNPVGTAWQWGFNNVTGNNTWTNFATNQNPVWTFGIGNYSVNLTATNSGGSSKFTNTTFINVTAVPPVAAFTMNKTSGYSPLAVSFTDTSNPVGTAWQWGFNNVTGNNTWTNFATAENPVWTFGIGNYSVNLTATNSGGSSKFTNTTFINVTAVPPVAAFTMNTTAGYSPLAVSFTDTSNPVGTSWQWGFNNVTGNNTWTNFATAENPVWTFGVGNYSVNLTATNAAGSSKFTNTTFINVTAALVPPTITGISPSFGPLTAGALVNITGTNLAGATSVTFGSSSATITGNTATTINTTAPAGMAGTVTVTVTTPGGTATTSYTYVAAPSVTLISPSSGPLTAGALVNITGTNLANATSVTFGSSLATIINNTATTINTTAPASSSAGPVLVTVTTPGGTATTSYTYVAAPSVTLIAPSSGPTSGGTLVNITGTNLVGATSVTFGSSSATITGNTATTINTTAPAGTAGTVTVTVTTPNGTSMASYTYVAAPTFVSAATNTAGTVISITFNKAMANPAGDQGQFTYSINGGTAQPFGAAALDSTNTIIDLTTSGTAIAYGNTVTVNYTAGSVASADGGYLATFNNQPVTNTLAQYVAITPSTSSVTMKLTPTQTTYNTNFNMTVSTNVPFTVTVADSNPSHGSAQGYLVNYTGTNYVLSPLTTLASPLSLTGTANSSVPSIQAYSITLPSGSILYSGTAAVSNQPLANTYIQPVGMMDKLLPDPDVYRIDLTFTITPA
jgi:PKD repeat protein